VPVSAIASVAPPVFGVDAPTILIVEDDEGIAELERGRLEESGYVVRVTTTPETGLAELDRGGIDLVLLDYRLPGDIDGLEFYTRMKAAGHDLPVVLVTAFSNEATVIRALRAGVRDFVTKSMEYMDYLPEAVGHVLRQVRTEHQLAESEARLAAIIESADDAVIIAEADLRVSLFNPAAERMFGCPSAEAIGRDLDEFLPPGDTPVAARARGVRADGTEFPVEASASRTSVGGRGFFTLLVRDVTERRRAEDALRQSERRFRAVFDQAAMGISLTAANGRVLAANPGFCRLIGYAPEEVPGLNDLELTHPADRDREAPHLAAVAEGDLDAYAVEKRYVRKSGRAVWANLTASVVRAPAGPVEYVVRIVEDVTDRRRAEERLREQADLLDRARDAILVVDLQGAVRYWNRGAQQLYGWSLAEVEGTSLTTLLSPTDAGPRDAALQAVRAAEEWNGELPHVTRAGRTLIVQSHWTLVRDEAGRPAAVLQIDTDVTDRRRLEDQLRQAQKMEAIGVLAGGVAHDFNNLLTVIQGYGEMLMQNPDLSADDRDLATEIHRAGDQAASLTRQLLAFSRKQVLAPRVLDVNALVRETEKMLRRLIGEDIEIVTTLDPSLGPVRADPGQLEQVVMNLAVNARDAMPRGGTLRIETRNTDVSPAYAQAHAGLTAGRYILLTVADTGVGMDDTTRARIFEPFFTTKGPGKGTGLGLATVHGIVRQSGGHLEVTSEVGKGTTFLVYLPRLADRAAPPDAGGPSAGVPRGTETVLLADDDPGVRGLARMALEAYGYTVLEAADGEAAYRAGAGHAGPVDLLVTDVVMPKMSGREVADRLVETRPGMKVLYISGYTDDAVVRNGVFQSTVAFLQKPFTPTSLGRKVREVLDA
jgi:two-component system, cell cycle sensor histidine kinase and response regulator CckA